MIWSLTLLLLIQSALGFEIQPKINNGAISSVADFPFFVNIGKQRHFCGGSLLNDRWILTAAHCLQHTVPLNITLGIGADGQYEQRIVVNTSYYHAHPRFYMDGVVSSYDIGLIELPEPIKFTASIRPAKLSIDCNDLDEGETVIAVGNGMTDENPQNSAHDTILRHGLSEVLPTIECARILYNLNNRDWVICTGSQAGQFALYGDSGGPLIRQNGGELVGITAFGCSRFQRVAFSKISYFFDWISHKTGLNLPKCHQKATF